MTSDRTISILFMIAVVAVPGDAGAAGVTADRVTCLAGSLVNLGISLGALCFLAGAYLLLPRSPAKRTLTVGGTPA